MTILDLLLIAAAGGGGAGLRYTVDVLIQRGRRGSFPLGILVVNVTGSLALGILTGLGSAVAPTLAAVIGIGLLGGYTTFSTVSTESVLLFQGRRRDWAWVNLVGTAVVCGVAAAVGLILGRLLGALLT